MKQKSVGLTLRAFIIALALILVAGSPALPPFDGVAYAQSTVTVTTLSYLPVPGTSNLQLDWTAVNNADSYQLWKAEGIVTTVAGWGDAPHMTFDDGSTIQYVDTDVTVGTTYSYVLIAYEGDTRLGYSNVLEIIGTAKPTAQPDVTLALMGLNAIKVTWTQVPTATHYRVRYWTAGLAGWMDLDDDATGLTLTHENLEAGRQYYYIVRGENSGGDGPYSGSPGNYDSYTIPATTDVPVLDSEQTSRTVVELDWTSAPAGSTYRLERRKVTTGTDGTSVPADNSGWAQLGGGNLSVTNHTDSAANYTPDAGCTATPCTVKYEYRVQAIDSNDVASDWSNVESVTIPAAGAVLSAPTGFSASAVSSSSIRVRWMAVTGAAFYELKWKSGDGNYNNYFRVDGTTYEHGNLSPSTKYTYMVRAVDINGAGDESGEAMTTTHSVTAAAGQMPKVTGLTVTDATTSNTGATRTAKLMWNAVSGATHYQIQRYNPGAATPAWADLAATGDLLAGGLLPKDDAGSPPTWEDVITTSAEDGAGQVYYYVVSAVHEGVDGAVTSADDNELGDWSDYKSVTFVDFEPSDPTSLTAAKTNGGSIIVRWTQPAADRTASNGVATSWTINWRTAATTSWSSIPVTGATSYHHTGLSGNTTYYYRVRAENSGGMSDFTEPVSEILGNALTAPTGVRAMDATDGATVGMKVMWNAVSGADSYEIQRFGFGAASDEWGSLTGTAGDDTDVPGTETTDTNTLTANTTYLYRVRMVKESVKSGWSAPASGTTMATAVTAAPTLVATTTGQSMIRLSWETVSGATAYHLEWLEGAQAATVFDNPNTNARRITISGNFRNYVHTGLKPGTQYSYRIRAVLSDGEGDWTTADVQPWTKPAAPDVSAAATNDTTITLTWDAVPVGSGHIDQTTGTYRVEWRIRNSGDDWAAVTEAPTCTNNECTVVDAALTASTHYQYRVRAEADGSTQGGHKSYWDYTNQRTPAAASN